MIVRFGIDLKVIFARVGLVRTGGHPVTVLFLYIKLSQEMSIEIRQNLIK